MSDAFLQLTRFEHRRTPQSQMPIHERRSIARATSQTVQDRHRTCDTTYSRNTSQNLRPVARAIVYATWYNSFIYVVKAYIVHVCVVAMLRKRVKLLVKCFKSLNGRVEIKFFGYYKHSLMSLMNFAEQYHKNHCGVLCSIFSLSIHQTTRFHARKCLLGVSMMNFQIYSHFSPKI